MLKTRHLISTAALASTLAACAVGPDYVKPVQETPAAFKEATGNWKTAEPQDLAPRGKWWERFGDPTLNQLEEQVDLSNQTVRLAESQYRQAQALSDAAHANFLPVVSASASADRARNGTGVTTNHNLSLTASWEVDVWGKLRRAAQASDASTQASAADLAAARLSAQAAVAQNYFSLRVVDVQKDLFARSVAAYEKSLQITRNKYRAGVVGRADVAQAETQLASTKAQTIDLDVQRSQLEHAVAVLTGQAPANFTLPPAPLTAQLPTTPPGLPSRLLERRPDIAAAERRAAAASAEIGVARAAYFPDLTLAASGGFASNSFAHWLTVPNRVWSIGPELAATLFDGGLREAKNKQAVAAWDGSVALYRQTVLNAFQDVEDNLAALRILEQEATAQQAAVASATESERLALNQYKAGTSDYLAVATAQTIALSNQRTAIQLTGRQLLASVLLIKGLGGGWEVAAQP